MSMRIRLLKDIDEDIRELLTLVHKIRIDEMLGDYEAEKEKLEDALDKIQKIYAMLYSLRYRWGS